MRILDRITYDSRNISSGFFLSVGLATFILMGASLLAYSHQKGFITLSGQYSFFFFITFLCLFLCIEWFVEREQRKVEQIRKEEIENLKKIEAYRREFLAEVSHELRTPIFAVQGYIHTLLDGAMDDDNVRMKFLEKAAKSSDRLSSLVNDLLVITQIEAGEIEMKMRRFVLYDVCLEVVDSLENKFINPKKNRHITCHIHAHKCETLYVLADRERIHQVLSNLIENAIKYGNQQGNITLSLQQKEDKLFVEITDDGPGIAPEHLENIFRRFYRIDKSRSRETGGTGLGLSICRHFIEAHGEQIAVKSEIGVGTTFSFHLKIKPENRE
jgi:two-component system, OmpR family, phosphate regulon sensor histidine kinase PhoR